MKEEAVDVSVVIPLFNERENIGQLYGRLVSVLSALDLDWELIFVDDGSTDGTEGELTSLAGEDGRVRALILTRNFGQHAALLAGFGEVRGDCVVTLDGDLQNPPEDLPRLLDALGEGYDVVSGRRVDRIDPLFRRVVSWLTNRLVSRATGQPFRDWGSMFRAYRRPVVDAICQYGEKSLFIPTFVGALGVRMAEIDVGHARRAAGRSKYGVLDLLRLYFDLAIGLTLIPVQAIALAGGVLASVGFLLGLYIFGRRIVIGPEVEGVFTVFAFFFIFFGTLLMAVGMLGEYVSRIYREVRPAPAFRVRQIVGADEGRHPRIAVVGCGDFGRACTEAVVRGRGNVVAVVACPEKEREEGSAYSSLHEFAFEHHIPLYRSSIGGVAALAPALKKVTPELIFFIPCDQPIPEEIAQLPRLGCIAIHMSSDPVTYEQHVDEAESPTGREGSVVLRHLRGGRALVLAQQRVMLRPGERLSPDSAEVVEVAARLVERHLAQIESGL